MARLEEVRQADRGERQRRRDDRCGTNATTMPPSATRVDEPGRAADATRRLRAGAAPPTALFTAQDSITVGAVTALHELGRRHDAALIGFDEVPFAEQLEPAVAVVGQDPYLMGRHAGRLLLDRMERRRARPWCPHRGRRTTAAAGVRHDPAPTPHGAQLSDAGRIATAAHLPRRRARRRCDPASAGGGR